MDLKKQTQGLRRTVVAAVLGFTMLVPVASAAETLADALVGAYNNSGLLDQNRAVLRAADEDVGIAKAALKPVVQWTGSLSQNVNRSVSAGSTFVPAGTRTSTNSLSTTVNLIASLLVYDFGATRYAVEATKETVLATRESLVSVEQQILLRAVDAYMTVIQTRDIVALRENNVRLLIQELRAARDRFEVGEVTRTDVALAEAQLAQARSGLAGAQGNLISAKAYYKVAVGREPGNLSKPPRLPAVSNSIKTAKALAVRSHPDIRAVQHQVAAAELLIRRSEAAMQPQVSVQGSVGISDTFRSEASTRSGAVGVQIGQTLYQGGALSAGVRKNRAQRDAQRGNLHVVVKDVERAVSDAYAGLASARAQIEASQRQVRAARIAFQGVREEAALGARTTLDVLDAEQSLLDAQSASVNAQTQIYVAAYSVLQATGQLTASKLKLPVQIYDPAAYYNLVKESPAKLSKEGKKLDRVLRALQKD
ncbi:TolC family outer membrane protein [Sulfitobacter sp. HGT1]|jgi:outer membrane protein|uniref:TolC family outer membrane protein n=1 Tax=unclassified Sulfitobacter TaxID=196795 RepID=UPI001592E0D2|nr:TolC family outer membrane protein [Sulfitobacter sp. HGT1]